MADAPSLRETIESAISSTAEPEPAETTSTPAPEPVETTSTTPVETEAQASERARDEKGRFAPKAEAEAAPKATDKAKPAAAPAPAKAETATPAPPAPVETSTKPAKIPQSWKPGMRELAAKLPPEFHPLVEEAYRRDVETQKVLQESTQARQLAAQVQQTLAPYETIARANGMDAMQYAGSVLQTAAVLQMGTQAQKDQALALLINQFGGTVEGINAHLSGQAPQAAPTQQPVNIQAEVQRALQQQVQTMEAQRAQTDAAAFIATGPEFLNDVWPDMIELIQVAERRGQKLPYQQAYDRACHLNEDVAKILDGRKAAEAAKAKAPSVQKSKAAASSIKASPVEATTQKKGSQSLRDVVADAFATAGRT